MSGRIRKAAKSRGSFPVLSFLHKLRHEPTRLVTTHVAWSLSFTIYIRLLHPAPKTLQSWTRKPPEDQNCIQQMLLKWFISVNLHLKPRPCFGAWGDLSEQMPIPRVWKRPKGNLTSTPPRGQFITQKGREESWSACKEWPIIPTRCLVQFSILLTWK